MKQTLLILSFLFLLITIVSAQTWHVSGTGNDADITLSTDIIGKARPKGPGRDRGAFEQ